MFAKQFYMATVLFHAIEKKKHKRTEEFLCMGANPNYLFVDDSSPIHVASSCDTDDPSFISLLLQYKGNPNLRNGSGLTPVHVAAACGNAGILQLLISTGGNPYQKDDDGKDSLSLAPPNIKHMLREYLAKVEKGEISDKELKMLPSSTCSDVEIAKLEVEKRTTPEMVLSSAASASSSYTTVTQLSDFSCFHSKVIPTDIAGLSLVETHLSPSDISRDLVSYISDNSDWRSFSQSEFQSSSDRLTPQQVTIPPEVTFLIKEELRARLTEFGEIPGPIVRSTRRTLELKLASYIQGSSPKATEAPTEFLAEVSQALSGSLDVSALNSLEEEMMGEFVDPNPAKNWREGIQKACFNYLLLDPRVTQNLPVRAKHIEYEQAFRVFLKSIFYIGKGRQSRPYEHFKEALTFSSGSNGKIPSNRKLETILDIWKSNSGVVSLHVFQNTIAVEAFTREACMIDALGLDRLTNQCRGQYYGPSDSWSGRRKRLLGAWLLRRAFGILLHEGERQIRPLDL